MTLDARLDEITQARLLLHQLEGHLDALERQAPGESAPAGSLQSAGAVAGEAGLERVIQYTGTLLMQAAPLATVEKALEHLIAIVGASSAHIWFRESKQSAIEKGKAAPGREGSLWQVQRLAKLAIDHLMTTRETLAVLDARRHPLFAEAVESYELDTGCLVCVPLFDADELCGAIYLDRSADTPAFSRVELKLASALGAIFARIMVIAIGRQAQEERRQHVEMLNRLYQAVSRTLSLDQVLDQVAQVTHEVTKAERTFIMLMINGTLHFAAGCDAQGPLAPAASRDISRSVVQKVLATNEGVYVFDASSDAEFALKHSVVNLQLNSIVAVPLLGQAGLAGVIYVDSKTKSLGGLEKEMAVLSAIAGVASLAVDNARLFRQATVDGLTGLFVRSYFLVRLDEEIQRCFRYGRVVSLLVMDIDHFKKFNDTYGHQTGDEVIKLVCQVIKQNLRAGVDVAGRYGGEELVVFLPETPAEGAMVVAERTRAALEAMGMGGPKGETLKVTMSIGVATFPAVATNAAQLFERADQALYASKQNGRNRVSQATPPAPAG